MCLGVDAIRCIDLTGVKPEDFKCQVSDSIILTHDHKILMQQRPSNWGRSAGCLTAFGGHVEEGETPLQGLVRELKEELGADMPTEEVIHLGSLTEVMTDHTELVHTHFWHDRKGVITGCYECEAVYYDRVAGALAHPKIMDYARWMLLECQRRKLLK
jgi:8-oxo-dGTP diphosphatase